MPGGLAHGGAADVAFGGSGKGVVGVLERRFGKRQRRVSLGSKRSDRGIGPGVGEKNDCRNERLSGAYHSLELGWFSATFQKERATNWEETNTGLDCGANVVVRLASRELLGEVFMNRP